MRTTSHSCPAKLTKTGASWPCATPDGMLGTSLFYSNDKNTHIRSWWLSALGKGPLKSGERQSHTLKVHGSSYHRGSQRGASATEPGGGWLPSHGWMVIPHRYTARCFWFMIRFRWEVVNVNQGWVGTSDGLFCFSLAVVFLQSLLMCFIWGWSCQHEWQGT